MSEVRHVVGCMTGSSLDGIDVALVRVVGRGLELRCDVELFGSYPLGDVGIRLRHLIAGGSVALRTVVDLAGALGDLHAEAIGSLIGDHRVDLVSVHGQTVLHSPPIGLQLCNPWPIAMRVGAPVVTSLRDADLALGGQGAPITPIADLVLFRHPTRRRAIVNLGGFCNITELPACEDARSGLDSLRGYDLCPCNHWLDGAARALLGSDHDRGGSAARRGRFDDGYSVALQARLESLSRDARSFGPSDEALPMPSSLSAEDALATIVRVIAHQMVRATRDADEILLAGGSVANRALVEAIVGSCEAPVKETSAVGIAPQAREAVAMAVLGALSEDGVAVCRPEITGASGEAVAGRWIFPRGRRDLSHG